MYKHKFRSVPLTRRRYVELFYVCKLSVNLKHEINNRSFKKCFWPRKLKARFGAPRIADFKPEKKDERGRKFKKSSRVFSSKNVHSLFARAMFGLVAKTVVSPGHGISSVHSGQRRGSELTAVGGNATSRRRQTGCDQDKLLSFRFGRHEFRSARKRDLTRPVCDVYTLVLRTDTSRIVKQLFRTYNTTHTHVYAMGTTADETDLFLRHLMWRFTH